MGTDSKKTRIMEESKLVCNQSAGESLSKLYQTEMQTLR
jgi:hypothetical protein